MVTGDDYPARDYPDSEITERIIACAIAVHRALGPGFLEMIYERAMAHEMRKRGLAFEEQKPVQVRYDGVAVGEHRADFLVEGKVIVELKSAEALVPKHTAQVISTLKAFGVGVGLLINFNEAKVTDGVRRVVLTSS